MATSITVGAANSNSSHESKRIMEGPLCKWTNVVHGWQYRWFVLDKVAGLLSYYTSREKMKRGSRRGCIKLKHAVIGIDEEDESTFTISAGNQTYHFQGQSSEEKDTWVQVLNDTIRQLQKPKPPVNVHASVRHKDWSMGQVLAEAEGYHSLLEEQTQALLKQLKKSPASDRISAEIKYLMEHVEKFISVIKDNQELVPSELVALEEGKEGKSSPGNSSHSLDSLEEEGREGEREGRDPLSHDSDSICSDEFFDPEAMISEEGPPPAVIQPVIVSVMSEDEPSDVEEDVEMTEVDDASKGVAQNKSLIMYMLPQFKIGMDLTRVTLPTFILEKRSLLEMYSDFFAHPDRVVALGSAPDPKQRMIEAVRHYLSSFHTARKGTIAKKPYNPVLGETFQCYWDLPGDARREVPPNGEGEELVRSGPVPFAHPTSFTFVAEQVSHHPPVSAFYAECPLQKVCVEGYVYTQSKFLGLSLGVHNIGKVHMHLLEHGEEYSSTLPSAYARSILTIPWMELGGKCLLECKQTGYYTNIEFHCKPFYGGRRHRVTADLYHVSNSGKPFLHVEGQWNGVMYVKHPNGDKEVFADTTAMPIIRKKIRKVERQGEMESKRKWQQVTEALLADDVEAATTAKHELEDKQRAEARERKEQGVEWKQKYFFLEEEGVWRYNHRLHTRLARKQE